MTRWIGIVAVPAPDPGGDMLSRLPAYLHPVCGRPLIWHSVSMLLNARPAPERVIVVGDTEVPDDFWGELTGQVVVVAPGEETPPGLLDPAPAARIVVDARGVMPAGCVAELLDASDGAWLATPDGGVAAARVADDRFADALVDPSGPGLTSGEAVVVRDRAGLAEATRIVRDRVVRQLMKSGVTFILPDSVTVDVDVRIGRDTVIYPGAVLEGSTTIGEETVIGPGCRVISSWVGSGVEMKGWNYIAHTSIRNRAILEPYVRRGFD